MYLISAITDPVASVLKIWSKGTRTAHTYLGCVKGHFCQQKETVIVPGVKAQLWRREINVTNMHSYKQPYPVCKGQESKTNFINAVNQCDIYICI